jgi:hypothetical protein
MRPATVTLVVLEATASVVLVYCAVTSHQNGSEAYTVVLGSLAVLFALSLTHTSYLSDELRAALVRLERASRPAPVLTPATDAVVAVAGWCCDTAVLTAGADHDPDTCTRKDTSR